MSYRTGHWTRSKGKYTGLWLFLCHNKFEVKSLASLRDPPRDGAVHVTSSDSNVEVSLLHQREMWHSSRTLKLFPLLLCKEFHNILPFQSF